MVVGATVVVVGASVVVVGASVVVVGASVVVVGASVVVVGATDTGGSNSSAVARGQHPPAASTLPVGSNVAVWLDRPVVIDPVPLQVPVAPS